VFFGIFEGITIIMLVFVYREFVIIIT